MSRDLNGDGSVIELYQHPIVLFGIGPAYLFILQQRLPIGMLCGGWKPWLSTMATNFAIVLVVATLIWFGGIGPFLLVHLPITLIAGSIGVWLFYVQHQFEPTFWARHQSGRSKKLPFTGAPTTSSRDPCGGLLQTSACIMSITCAVESPYYRLPNALRDHPELISANRLTILESFRCVRLALWDERERRLVPFSAALRSKS